MPGSVSLFLNWLRKQTSALNLIVEKDQCWTTTKNKQEANLFQSDGKKCSGT